MAAGAVVLTASQGLTGVSYGFAGSFLVLWCARFAIVSNLSGAGVMRLVRQHLAPLFASLVMAGGVAFLTHRVSDWSAMSQIGLGSFAGVLVYALASQFFMRDRLDLVKKYLSRS